MNKKIKLISTILMVVVMLSMICSTTVMAASGIIDGMQPTYSDNSGITNVGQKIVDIISTVAVVVAVIVLLIIGIKYMMGSASEKAEYKKTMIPYLVGAVIVFGAGAIAKVVVSMSQSIMS